MLEASPEHLSPQKDALRPQRPPWASGLPPDQRRGPSRRWDPREARLLWWWPSPSGVWNWLPATHAPGGASGDHHPSTRKLASLSQGLLGNLNPHSLFQSTCLKGGLRVTALGAAAPGSVSVQCRGETTGASITPPQAALSGLRVSDSGPIFPFFPL